VRNKLPMWQTYLIFRLDLEYLMFVCRGMELTLWQCWLYRSKKELLTQYAVIERFQTYN
jgi:hypothetical protein